MCDVARPVRMEPERVDRVDLVLRADRVEGVRPEPVRVEVDPARAVLGAAVVDAVLAVPGAAMPHLSQ
jgi:hypothetical protein